MADIIARARTQLIVHHAFFASIALKRPIIADPSIKTADVNARGRIRYSPEFVETLTLQQVVFLIAHECMHFMQDNFTRMGNRNPKKWNRATDAVNNETLIAANVGQFIEGGVRWPNAENMTAEEVYRVMPDEPGDGDGDGEGGTPGGTGGDMDHSESADMTPSEKKELQQEIQVELARAAMAAKQMGQMPGALERLVRDILQPKTPWYDKLERFMTQRVKVNYSWSRPNKRFMSMGIYMPSISGQGLGEVAIIRDTSGSVGDSEHAAFKGHVSRILEECRPTLVHIIDVDTQVAGITTLTPDQLPFDAPIRGGGGTDMCVGFKHVEEMLPDVECCILLTDGYTDWPDSVSVPAIVVTTGVGAPDHVGETIKIEVE